MIVAASGNPPLKISLCYRLIAEPRQSRVDVGDGARDRHRRIGNAVAHRVGEFVARVTVNEIERALAD